MTRPVRGMIRGAVFGAAAVFAVLTAPTTTQAATIELEQTLGMLDSSQDTFVASRVLPLAFDSLGGAIDFRDDFDFSVGAGHTFLSSVINLELGSTLDVSDLFVQLLDSAGTEIASGTADNEFVIDEAIAAGDYTLRITGTPDGTNGGAYMVGLSVVPIPAAAWLFGTAVLGFAVVSRRRRASEAV